MAKSEGHQKQVVEDVLPTPDETVEVETTPTVTRWLLALSFIGRERSLWLSVDTHEEGVELMKRIEEQRGFSVSAVDFEGNAVVVFCSHVAFMAVREFTP